MRVARGELLAFSDANALWEPDALRAPDRRVRGSRRSATRAARCGSSTTPGRTRRASTGATRCGCASTSRRSPRSPPATARSTRCGRRLYLTRRRGDGPRPLVPVQPRQARLARRVRAGGAGDREDGADGRGRMGPQAADDDPRVADRRARRAARPARLSAAVRADDRARTGCCATPRRCCTCSSRWRRSRCSRRGAARTRRPPRAQAAPCWRRRGRRPRPRARPLLVARYYVLTTAALGVRPVRLAAPRDRGRLGAPEGTR